MSAVEVIEQIKRLPREEQRKVAVFLDEIEKPIASRVSKPQVSEEFKRVADEVFATNAELFRKLAS
jgi:hypothetical protein